MLHRCMFSNSPDVWEKSNTPPQLQLINPLGVREETELVNDIHKQNGWSALSSIYISRRWFATDEMRKLRTN